MSTLKVVEQVLREVGNPMSVREIIRYVTVHGKNRGLRLPTRSRTPDTVVSRDLAVDIKNRGAESLFVRTAPGRFTLREFVAQAQPPAEMRVDAHANSAPFSESRENSLSPLSALSASEIAAGPAGVGSAPMRAKGADLMKSGFHRAEPANSNRRAGGS